MKNKIPYSLLIFRGLCAPVMIYLAFKFGYAASSILICLLYAGLLSDIADGIIARHLKIATPQLRRLDSQVDLLFWIGVGISAYLLNPELIQKQSLPFYILFITEGLCYVISIIRFKKETCCHAWISKLWGLSLLAAFTAIIGFGSTYFWYNFAIVLGILSHLDRILITLIIPEWTHDIPSTYHAILLRQGKSFKKYKLFN